MCSEWVGKVREAVSVYILPSYTHTRRCKVSFSTDTYRNIPHAFTIGTLVKMFSRFIFSIEMLSFR